VLPPPSKNPDVGSAEIAWFEVKHGSEKGAEQIKFKRPFEIDALDIKKPCPRFWIDSTTVSSYTTLASLSYSKKRWNLLGRIIQRISIY
jgi:hypothetical protein